LLDIAIERFALQFVYKLSDADSWRAAEAAGRFFGSADDLRDGFIHFSTAAQVPATAMKYYSDVADLVVAAIDVAPLGPALKWESSRGGALFPHLYAPLDMSAVRWTRHVGRNSRHEWVFPPEMV
jgi:uncharacterized protein (DUF952 family)